MPHLLALLLALFQLLLPAAHPQTLPERLRSGEWLRFHVIAQDDTPEMQRVKLCVRDAVQACYQEARSDAPASMLAEAEALLPLLTETARQSAQAEGYTGAIEVTLGTQPFDDRTLQGIPVPAGDYPALVIRLGAAEGQNWWGLLDPELAFRCASSSGDEAPPRWDWSLAGLLAALFGIPQAAEGA